MIDAETLSCDQKIIQLRVDLHTVQLLLDGGGVIVVEGFLELSSCRGNVTIDVKSPDRDINVLSALLERTVQNVTFGKSCAKLEIEGGYCVGIQASGRGGEAGLIRIGDRIIVIA